MQKEEVQLLHCKTKDQVSNVLTKALPKAKVEFLRVIQGELSINKVNWVSYSLNNDSFIVTFEIKKVKLKVNKISRVLKLSKRRYKFEPLSRLWNLNLSDILIMSPITIYYVYLSN